MTLSYGPTRSTLSFAYHLVELAGIQLSVKELLAFPFCDPFLNRFLVLRRSSLRLYAPLLLKAQSMLFVRQVGGIFLCALTLIYYLEQTPAAMAPLDSLLAIILKSYIKIGQREWDKCLGNQNERCYLLGKHSTEHTTNQNSSFVCLILIKAFFMMINC